MSISQLRSSLTEMQFNIEFFSDPDHHFTKLLQILQNQNRFYDVITVKLCGILLGIGDLKEKAGALYKIYENNDDKFLYKDKCKEMIEDIINMAVKKIPFIAADDSEQPMAFTLPMERIESYTDILMKMKNSYLSSALERLFIDQIKINFDEFCMKLENDPVLESFCWGHKIRNSLYQ